ncbi:MAG TPA: SDR family NAD(P)-dependent oxidoreductase [Polyangiaceae bacterium]|jgi:NADP-dependent 3-hydroxy acid dehydrogenase YdfG
MAKTMIVGGYGPGISNAVAEKFGAEGFSIALVGRNEERLAAGVKSLGAKGVTAKAFPANVGDTKAVESMIARVRESFGGIHALHWNATPGGAPKLLGADTAAIHTAIDIAVTGLLAAVRASLADLKKDHGALLVTNGGFGFFDPKIDAMAVQFGAEGLALANAAKHKLVGLLAESLRPEGVYVGEVMVNGTVKGTSFDRGNATLDPKVIAEKFWSLYQARSETYATVM